MSKQERLNKLEQEYAEFMKTEDGRKWKERWQAAMGSDDCGDFDDYLYDFYTEMLA